MNTVEQKIRRIKILELPTCTVAQLVRSSARQADVMAFNRRLCRIFYLFHHVFLLC